MNAKIYDVQTPAGVVVTAPQLVPFVRERTLIEEFLVSFSRLAILFEKIIHIPIIITFFFDLDENSIFDSQHA